MPCNLQVTSRLWITPICRAPTSVQLNSQFLRLCEASHNRKNWLFSQTQAGARASANLYSLIETAKGHGLEPYAYLRRVFKEQPLAETVNDIDALLPGGIKGGGS